MLSHSELAQLGLNAGKLLTLAADVDVARNLDKPVADTGLL